MKDRTQHNLLRHIASRVESLPFLRSVAAQHLERLQLLHDDVRALRGEILNLHDQSSIVAANVHHLASRIDGLQMLLPAYETPSVERQPPDADPSTYRIEPLDAPSAERQQNVTNADADRPHIVDPIT